NGARLVMTYHDEPCLIPALVATHHHRLSIGAPPGLSHKLPRAIEPHLKCFATKLQLHFALLRKLDRPRLVLSERAFAMAQLRPALPPEFRFELAAQLGSNRLSPRFGRQFFVGT